MSLTEQTNAVKVAIQNAFSTINQKVEDAVGGSEQTLLNYTDVSVANGLNDIVRYNPVIVENSAEVEYQKGQEESFSDVFNNWKRISHQNNDQYPSNPAELNSWSYDEIKDTISCTINSGTLVGFINPKKYDNYNFEVRVSSTASDDDGIGICLAFVESNGREYTITAVRNPAGLGIGSEARFQIIYNYLQSDQYIIAQTGVGLSTGGGWSDMLDGIKIRAERTGSTFVVKTTDNDGTEYVPGAELTFDLGDDSRLTKFQGPQSYGYVAYSQANSTWETLARPIDLDEIVDIDNGVKWEYDGTQWNSTALPVGQTSLDPRRFYYNEATQKLYVSDDTGSPIRILLPDHLTSDDHDGRYYPRDELDAVLLSMVNDAMNNGHTHPWSQISGTPATANRWPAWSEVSSKPVTFPAAAHNHDDRYHQKSEITALLDDKVDAVVGRDLSENDFTDALLVKLNGIETGAEVNVPTNLTTTLSASQVVLLSSTGSNVTLPAATTTNAGVMSSADKVKLNSVNSGAEANPSTTASRGSSSTSTVLQAKAFVDHNASGDHDGRYYTKSNVDGFLADKLGSADVVNVLTSNAVNKALSAAQGKALKTQVDNINTLLQSDTGTLDTLQEVVDFIQLNRTDLDSLTISSIAGLQSALNGKVDAVAGKQLSSNDFTNALLSKLNGIAASADVNVPTNLTQSRNATSYTVVSSTGSNTTLAAATGSAAGVMTSSDKSKLDGISAGANNYVHPGNSFSMGTLNGATVISKINVDANGHVASVATRNITKSDVGLSNVPNVNATNAGNISAGTLPAARLSGSYGINITGTAGAANRLSTARTINGVSFNGTSNITIYDNTKVAKSGGTMTGRLNIGGSDDGVHDLQVDGDTSLRGNVGVNNSDPSFAVDVNGDIRVRDGFAIKFGGTGANDAKFELRYNATTQTLDFNYLG